MLLPVVRASDSALLVRGTGGTSARHAHHWGHLILGLEAELRSTTDGAAARSAPGVLTPPDLPHAIEARGPVALLYFEPESRIAVSLTTACAGRIRLLSVREAEAVRGSIVEDVSPEAVLEAAAEAIGAPAAAPLRKHPAVTRVTRWLAQAPPDADVSLEALARIAKLSPNRFMHVFTEHVGLPLRPYVRWLRLRRAAAALARGASATEAASLAGFADAAHMTRTFRSMLGVTPSEIARRSQSVQAK